MADGTKVAIVKGEPVPPPVIADIQAGGLATEPAGSAPDGVTGTKESGAAFQAYLVQKTIELGGRQIVAVVHVAGYTEANTYTTGYYLPLQPGVNYPTSAEAVAVATKYSETVGAATHPVVLFDFPL